MAPAPPLTPPYFAAEDAPFPPHVAQRNNLRLRSNRSPLSSRTQLGLRSLPRSARLSAARSSLLPRGPLHVPMPAQIGCCQRASRDKRGGPQHKQRPTL